MQKRIGVGIGAAERQRAGAAEHSRDEGERRGCCSLVLDRLSRFGLRDCADRSRCSAAPGPPGPRDLCETRTAF
jgi:hypothetical protein